MSVHHDRALNRMTLGWLMGVAALLAAAWLLGTPREVAPAYGQVPDAGLQRQVMIEELRNMNKKLAEMAETLREIRAATPPPERKPDARPAAKP